MRPRATMPVVLYECVPAINSFGPPPAYTTAPVSPSQPCSRWSPGLGLSSVPTIHTVVSLVPSVEVTKGDPHPFGPLLHAMEIAGGLVAVMRKARSRVAPPRKATYVPWLVRYVAAAWMSRSLATCNEATGALMP